MTSSKIDDGGPAFPPHGDAFGYVGVQTGMSRRDYFAARIAAGMAAFSGTSGISYGPGEIAGRAYQVADAMIAASKVGEDR